MCDSRAVASRPVGCQVLAAGSKSSARLVMPVAVSPPATSNFPFGSRVAQWLARAVVRLAMAYQSPVGG